MNIVDLILRVLPLTVVLCSATNASAEDKIDETKIVGFACFYEGGD
jgi:hypothetical protein